MGRKITLACCALNQWAMDFGGNLSRILKSCRDAKEKSASYRLGPELEIPGYGCADHFLENDTELHSFEVLAELLQSQDTRDLLCDVGMPVLHKGVRYNCRILFYNKKIVLIRPKMHLAMDGNYRESRWFTAWTKHREVEEHILPNSISSITGQATVAFGDAVVMTQDTILGCELCEELFTGNSPHISLALNGVEIITNSSASHFQLRKLHTRVDLIQSATSKCGGVYVYSNCLGCDGERLYYDGCCLVAVNGEVVAQGSQFTLSEVEVTTATVELDDVTSYRGAIGSRGMQAEQSRKYPVCQLPVTLCYPTFSTSLPVSTPRAVKYLMPEEEIAIGPACWLWDFLRRSGMAGFFLPLSGGIDSSSTACVVASMCELVLQACHDADGKVINDLRRVLRLKHNGPLPATVKELAMKIFTTCYMGSTNSSESTRMRAASLADQIGSHHMTVNIDEVVESCMSVFQRATLLTPKFRLHGGSGSENLALQNVQARSRMILSYLFSQLLPWSKSKQGSLLVLGSTNVDESLFGYLTKYDCSSADINPIGGISKKDLRGFCKYMSYKFPSLKEIIQATPTAELEPMTDSYCQSDEEDMGLTYDELSDIGRLRKVHHCGPYTMFLKLIDIWKPRLEPESVAEKVKRFFRFYSINRHKMTVLTPSFHAENYSPDDNRHDLRQFLYNTTWEWQFRAIDNELSLMKEATTATFDISARNKDTSPKSHEFTEKTTEEFTTAQSQNMDTWSSLSESPQPTLSTDVISASAERKRKLCPDPQQSSKRPAIIPPDFMSSRSLPKGSS